MKRRIISLFLMLCVAVSLITAVPITISAATNGTCGDNLTWALDDNGTLTISGIGDMTSSPWHNYEEIIHSVIINYGVTSICDNAFATCGMTSISIPNSVTSIGDSAFNGCTRITKISIPDSVTDIGDFAFGFCDSLIYISVNNNNNNYSSIYGNLYDKNQKMLLQYATGKKNNSFAIPDGVIGINVYALNRCKNLTKIRIPASIANIDVGTFAGCSNLNDITVDSSNANYSSIDGNLYDKSKKTLIQYATGKKDTSFHIPNSVINIADNAFSNCILTSVSMPDSISNIGRHAFWCCSSLISISISRV